MNKQKSAGNLIRAGAYHKQSELDKICARYDLKADEFHTVEEKALLVFIALNVTPDNI